MADIKINRLANVLVNYSTKVKAGDWVHINANWQAIPLVKEVVILVAKMVENFQDVTFKMHLNKIIIAQASNVQL